MYDIIRREKASTKSIKNSRLIQKKSKPHTTINSNDIRICYNSYNNVTQCCGFSQLDINKANGQRAENLAWQEISLLYPNIEKQVTVEVNTGSRTVRIRVDIVAQKGDGSFVLYEVKASSTAPLTKNQRGGYHEIFTHGATIISPDAIDKFGTNIIPPGTDGFRVEP